MRFYKFRDTPFLMSAGFSLKFLDMRQQFQTIAQESTCTLRNVYELNKYLRHVCVHTNMFIFKQSQIFIK